MYDLWTQSQPHGDYPWSSIEKRMTESAFSSSLPEHAAPWSLIVKETSLLLTAFARYLISAAWLGEGVQGEKGNVMKVDNKQKQSENYLWAAADDEILGQKADTLHSSWRGEKVH